MDSGEIECERFISPVPLERALRFRPQTGPGSRYVALEWGAWPVSGYVIVSCVLLACAIGLIVMDWFQFQRLVLWTPLSGLCFVLAGASTIPWIGCLATRRTISIDVERRELQTRFTVWGRVIHEHSAPLHACDLISCETRRTGYRGGPLPGVMAVLVTEHEAIVLASGGRMVVDEFARSFRDIAGLVPRGTTITVQAPDYVFLAWG